MIVLENGYQFQQLKNPLIIKKQRASHLDCTLWHPPALSRLPLEPLASQDLVARALRVLPPTVAEQMRT